MADPKSTPAPPAEAKGEPKPMTADQAAKRVKRTVTTFTEKKDGDGVTHKVPKTERVAVSGDEILDFKDRGDYVVVVTRDGQKLRSDDQA